ncbi:MAG: Xaa-Pro peptidase family protein [Lentilactobacillus buchneri]|jgi:Xaa-Pro aminopeptidase|nr:Xaa-Pro peptidase family protein [Lentilactobacillus buchneri]
MSKRIQKEIITKIISEIDKDKLDACVFSSPDGVFYSTGFQSRGLYRSGKTGGTLSFVTNDGQVWLICSEFEKLSAQETCDASVNILSYPVWIYIEDYAHANDKKDVQPSSSSAINILVDILENKFGSYKKIGIQFSWLNLVVGNQLQDKLSKYELVDCENVLVESRVKKTDWEIDILRYNAQSSEIAMNKTANIVVPGNSIKDIYQLFDKYSRENEKWVSDVSHAHTVGSHFNPYWNPTDERVKRGDLIRLDGGPYTEGYKSDLGRTFAVGNYVNDESQHIYDELWKGFYYGVNHIKPGVRFCDLFRGIDNEIDLEKYNYVRGHYGHSLSCAVDGEEGPFISPSEERTFEPGMVMCLETPFYGSKHQTFNIEDTFLVTENGAEFFTHASPSLFTK